MTPLDAESLKHHLAGLPGWTHHPERGAISRSFRFANFAEAFGFMAQMAAVSERLDHHPEWFNVYNRVDMTLTTHDCQGLSQRDVDMARLADAAFQAMKGTR